jgi:hypothetical protein
MKRNTKEKALTRRELLEIAPELFFGLTALGGLMKMLPRDSLGATAGCDITSGINNKPHRKYLVNIECAGGIDNHYLANGLEGSQFSGFADRYGRFSAANGRNIGNREHPLSTGHYIGAGLQPDNFGDFNFNNSLSDLFILKGLQVEGQHLLGNRIISNGGSSVYNAGFCSLVADSCSKEREKAFQHVALGGMGNNQVGNLKGSAVPMLVSNLQSFLASVSDVANDPNALDRKKFVTQMVRELASSVAEKTMEKCESKKLFSTFGNFFDQVMGVREKPLLYSDPSHNWDEINNWWGGFINHQRSNHPLSRLQLSDRSGNPTSYFNSGFAFFGAMTEFLIRRDLASVLSFGFSSDDRHGVNRRGGFLADGQNLGSYGSVMMGLIHRLKKIDIGGGKSLLDQTLIVTTSEFDRGAPNDGLEGTDHSGTHTILMAGSGYRGVLGGQSMNSGMYAGYVNSEGNREQYGNLTVQPDGTPESSGSGIPLSVSCVAPMITKMMGAVLPSQQITQASQNVDALTFIKRLSAA